ncbi:MAG: hypothetical protein IJL00_01710 [Clostridia bacterium]|nr:hypothetical protein [Clostridia bacterium]
MFRAAPLVGKSAAKAHPKALKGTNPSCGFPARFAIRIFSPIGTAKTNPQLQTLFQNNTVKT